MVVRLHNHHGNFSKWSYISWIRLNIIVDDNNEDDDDDDIVCDLKSEDFIISISVQS